MSVISFSIRDGNLELSLKERGPQVPIASKSWSDAERLIQQDGQFFASLAGTEPGRPVTEGHDEFGEDRPKSTEPHTNQHSITETRDFRQLASGLAQRAREVLFADLDRSQGAQPLLIEAAGSARALPFEAAMGRAQPEFLRVCDPRTALFRVGPGLGDTSLWRDQPPRVLFVDAVSGRPGDGRIQAQSVRQSWKAATEMLKVINPNSGDFVFEEIAYTGGPGKGIAALSRLTRGSYDIVQLVAHGTSDGEYLRLGTDRVSVHDVSEAIAHAEPSVVLLNSCFSSTYSDKKSLAELLALADVPLTIAARHSLPASVAAAFSEGFFGAVASGLPIADAVCAGRTYLGRTPHSYYNGMLTAHISTRLLDSAHPAAVDGAHRKIAALWDQQTRENTVREAPYRPQQPPQIRSLKDLLAPHNRVLDVIGRERELNTLTGWANSPGLSSVAALVGEGGWGKTRLGLEFVDLMRAQGWSANEVAPCGLGESAITAVTQEPGDTLLFIDYAGQVVEEVCNLVRRWINSANTRRPGAKLRLLLVLRVRPWNGTWLDVFKEVGGLGQLERYFEPRSEDNADGAVLVDVSTRTESIPLEDLAHHAIERFTVAWPTSAPVANAGDSDFSWDRDDTPLGIAVRALAHLSERVDSSDLDAGPIEWLRQHEMRVWKDHRTIHSPDDCELAVATTVLTRPGNVDELRQVLSVVWQTDESKAEELASWVEDVLGGALSIEPDRLAEAIVAHALKSRCRNNSKWWDQRLLPAVEKHQQTVMEVIRRAERHCDLPRPVLQWLNLARPQLLDFVGVPEEYESEAQTHG